MITRESFGDAIAPFYGEMSTLATKWCFGDRQRAEDAIQDALLKAYLSLDQFEDRNFKQWVFTILKNVISTSGRPKRHGWSWTAGAEYIETSLDPEIPLASHEPQPLQQIYFKETSAIVEKFQESLSKIDHEIFTDAIDGVPQLDTANRLNISRPIVTKRLFKMREQLRKQFHEHN